MLPWQRNWTESCDLPLIEENLLVPNYSQQERMLGEILKLNGRLIFSLVRFWKRNDTINYYPKHIFNLNLKDVYLILILTIWHFYFYKTWNYWSIFNNNLPKIHPPYVYVNRNITITIKYRNTQCAPLDVRSWKFTTSWRQTVGEVSSSVTVEEPFPGAIFVVINF